MNPTNPKVDGYIRKSKPWQAVLQRLRMIVLGSGLNEEIKWRAPCYTFENHNVAFIGTLKDCCVLSFIKGALLKDPKGILVKPGENTQSGRIIRFTDIEQIDRLEPVLKTYLAEAIAIEKAGLKVEFKKITEFAIPEELEQKFAQDPEFKAAFKALTPGRQRGYLIHYSGAKQFKTRISRIEKSMPRVFEGKGMLDD